MARIATTRLRSGASARAEGEPTQQSIKSAMTRKRVIDATIRCLVKYGYSNTTTPRVAIEAGLSRGAMLHHFENGSALMQAAITELHDKRLRAFGRAVNARKPGDDIHSLVHANWKQLSSPSFVAFHELAIAARTDANLAAILKPAQVEYGQRWHRLAVDLFPEWQSDPASFELALAISQAMLEGMALARLTHGLDEALVEPLLASLEQQIQALKPAAPKRTSRAKRSA